ncbi:hypothetical protein [Pararobbsia alpina]|nr:hypothetical protein [Pararobbsia alpina]
MNNLKRRAGCNIRAGRHASDLAKVDHQRRAQAMTKVFKGKQ